MALILLSIIARNVVIVGLLTMLLPKGTLTGPADQYPFGEFFRDKKVLLPNEATCGIQHMGPVSGDEMYEQPWLTLLVLTKPKGRRQLLECGSLISSRYVLTAAHCIVKKANQTILNPELTHVRLGEWQIGNAEKSVDVAIEKSITHELYQPQNRQFYNDIALLRLAQRVKFTDFIKPICLPIRDDLKNVNYDGKELDSAGWGINKIKAGSTVKSKRKVKLPVVKHSMCESVFARFEAKNVTSNQICVGYQPGPGSCRGDAGPLLVARSHNWFVIGIASYGSKKCDQQGIPFIYTRVSDYLEWIISKLES